MGLVSMLIFEADSQLDIVINGQKDELAVQLGPSIELVLAFFNDFCKIWSAGLHKYLKKKKERKWHMPGNMAATHIMEQRKKFLVD